MSDFLNNIIIKGPDKNYIFPLIIDIFKVSNSKNSFEPKILFTSLKHLKDLDCSETTGQRALSHVKRQIDNPQVIAELKDKDLSPEIRSRRLSTLLEQCHMAMLHIFPGLRNSSTLANSLIDRSSIDDEYQNANASLRFGMALDYDTPTLFGTAFHELTHIKLIELGLSSIGETAKGNLESSSIHEFIADLGTFAMYGKLCNGNERRLNNYIESDFNLSGINSRIICKSDIALEEHQASKIVLKQLIAEANKRGIRLSELFPAIFDASIQVVKNQRGKNFYSFTSFANKLAEHLNEQGVVIDGQKLNFSSPNDCPDSFKQVEDKLPIPIIQLPNITINVQRTRPSVSSELPAWIEFRPEAAVV